MLSQKLFLLEAFLLLLPGSLYLVYTPVFFDLEKHPQQKREWEEEYPHPPQLALQHWIILSAYPCHSFYRLANAHSVILSTLILVPF